MKITSTIQIRGANPYLHIEAAQAAQIKKSWRKPMPVLLKINGAPKTSWKTSMMPVGNGDFYLYLHGGMRKISCTGVGDTITISVAFDHVYKNGPAHPMPKRFADHLAKNKSARESWEKLPPSRKKEILRYFATLKSTEARQRNIAKALRVLSGSKERFMGRLWENGI